MGPVLINNKGSVMVSLGDSLAFPRNDRESASAIENTWVQIAHKSSTLQSLWFRNCGAATSKRVLSEAAHVLSYLPESSAAVFVVQCGIVDCTPRPLPRRAFMFLKKLFPRRLALYSLLYLLWGKPWVSPKRFRRNMEKLFLKISSHPSFEAQGGGLVVLGIQDPGPNLTKITGFFSVTEYNSILSELAARLDRTVYIDEKVELHPDGHHLSKKGHFQLAASVISALDALGFSIKFSPK